MYPTLVCGDGIKVVGSRPDFHFPEIMGTTCEPWMDRWVEWRRREGGRERSEPWMDRWVEWRRREGERERSEPWMDRWVEWRRREGERERC
jgi:hypothetical protein